MATYTEITRDEFETWLLDLCPVAERVQGKQGVYAIPVSNDVHLYISTSIGSAGVAVAKGHGACHMKLQGRHNGRCLNRKDLGQTRFNRTTGWKVNWTKGVERMYAAYDKHADFYDRLGRETQPEYAARMQVAIDAQPNPNSPFFNSMKVLLQEGKWLTPKQEAVIVGNKDSESPKPRANELQAKKIEVVTSLQKAAQDSNNVWLLNFTTSILQLLHKGRKLSPRQIEVLEQNLDRFGIENPLAA